MRVSYANYYGKLLRDGGFSLAKGMALPLVRRQAVKSGAYAMAYPVSAYAPWEADEDFQRIYQSVRKHTLVDVWRCHELYQLVDELREIPGAIVEVGVWRGGTGAVMAQRSKELGLPETVYLCDTWEGVVKTTERDPYYHDGKHDDTSRDIVDRLVKGLSLDNVRLLQGIFPDDTAHEITEDALRLCHIDVDVYQSAKDVFEWAWPRLSTGGVVVFDDYGCAATPGVTQFVNEQRSLTDRLVVHNLNGHGIVVKR